MNLDLSQMSNVGRAADNSVLYDSEDNYDYSSSNDNDGDEEDAINNSMRVSTAATHSIQSMLNE